MSGFDSIRLVQGDYGHVLGLTLTNPDANDAPVDVSGATVRLYFKKVGESVLTATIVGTKPTGGADGSVEFQWPQGALDEPGRYIGEVEIDTGSKRHTIYELLKFVVRPQEEV